MMKIKKEVRDGNVAVLYAPGHGAGWSTWADFELESDRIVFDPSIVYMVEQMNSARDDGRLDLWESWVDNIKEYCAGQYPELYMGAVEDLQIAWIPEGTQFRITEYDGYEEIEYKEDDVWLTA